MKGYGIFRVKDAEYPGIVRTDADSSQVGGILYENVADDQLKVLDLFEGDLYRRQLLDVIPESGITRKAWCYVIRDENKSLLTGEPWLLSDFLEHGLQKFMTGYVQARKNIYRL